MKNNQKGFTLIELIVVIAIIGILASVMMPKFVGFTDKANKKVVMTEARAIYAACESILIDEQAYPSDNQKVWDELGKDLSTDDNGAGVLTIDAGNKKFTYSKKFGDKTFEATVDKEVDTNGNVTKEKITVTKK